MSKRLLKMFRDMDAVLMTKETGRLIFGRALQAQLQTLTHSSPPKLAFHSLTCGCRALVALVAEIRL